MLDQDTKRRIDTARDILVGKLPNPQAQVEQITIAMIYKFMDDMDKEAMEFGGEASFFAGEFEKYSWTKIFDPRLGGYELLALYGEAIEKHKINPNLPQLFRDIFKNAFLPYRDPETLKMFLKIINEFHYDHSEKLGDAFEYLLSVLGSQGDAGQFRTPRHIIDFMVAIMQPKKEESICDPACGTAGFLISSYKHILNENTKKNKGDLLTPDDRKKLINNFVGYDISAEMVRLSLVNLYLHGFTTPKIFEYDTLTSEDRWGDYFDIILANPPFMTPKGGIRPHKKFAMQANRSEVLFVDYIMEHINPTTGRAAIIVPEGIIFQSATAYKALRKLLVDKNFLYGVISLPAGIFQPYSGVKTSILLLDKSLAKKSDNILFVKVENDGFALGAQRKELTTSDLPDAINLIKQYNSALRDDDFSTIDTDNLPLSSLIIEKSKIAENEDYNLSADRYRVNISSHFTKFDLVSLGDLVDIKTGKKDVNQGNPSGMYPFFTCAKEFTYSDDYSFDTEALLIAGNGVVGDVKYYKGKFEAYQRTYVLDNFQNVLPKYLFFLLKELLPEYLNGIKQGNTMPYIKVGMLFDFKIPLPPLAIQQIILEKLEQCEKVVAGAKLVVDNYKPQIDINPEWEQAELGEICEVINGRAYKQEELLETGKYPVLRVGNFFSNRSWYYSDLELPEDKYCNNGDLLYAWSASFGPKIWDEGKVIYHYHIWKMVPNESRINKMYLFYLLEKDTEDIKSEGGRGIAMMHITKGGIEKRLIPLPSIHEQEVIVAKIEYEKKLVASSTELIDYFEQKIKDEINKLWAE
jgi:type I restriction enzyme M protein